MKLSSKVVALTTVGAAALCMASPSFAASPATDAFIANVRPNVIFLDTSSRLALDKSPSRAIRGFAHNEAKQQTIAANSMTAWIETSTPRGEIAAIGAPAVLGPLAPVASLATVPVGLADNVIGGVGNVVTGRSVGIDTPLTVTPAPTSAQPTIGSQLLPAERSDMARLQSLSGRQFDVLYKATQMDGLTQLATLYRDYIANGDDPALRALSVTELPKVQARIADLQRL